MSKRINLKIGYDIFDATDGDGYKTKIINLNDKSTIAVSALTYPNEFEAKEAYNDFCENFIHGMEQAGAGEIINRDDEVLEVEVEPNSGVLNQEYIGVGIIVDNTTNKCGLAVMDRKGNMILEPDKWFDTPLETFNHFMLRKEYIELKLEQKGYDGFDITIPPDEIERIRKQMPTMSTKDIPAVNISNGKITPVEDIKKEDDKEDKNQKKKAPPLPPWYRNLLN